MNQPEPSIPDRAENKVPPALPVTNADLKKLREKLNIPQATLKDQIALWLADQPDKVEWIGEALIGYSAKYEGYIKYALLGVGYGIKYAGQLIDKKIMRAGDLKQGS